MSGYWPEVEVQIDVWAEDSNGALGKAGYSDMRNPVNVTIQPQSPDIKERISNRPGTSGQALDSIVIAKPQQVVIAVDDVHDAGANFGMLAAAFNGEEATFSQSAITAAGWAIDIKTLGRSFTTGYENLAADSVAAYKVSSPTSGVASGQATSSTSTVLTKTAAAWTVDDLIGKSVLVIAADGTAQVQEITDNDETTITVDAFDPTPAAGNQFYIVETTALTAGLDYSVDVTRGQIKPLTGGTLAVDDVIAGTLDAYAISGPNIKGATKDSITFSVIGETRDKVSGRRGRLTIHKVTAYASENQELVAGDYAKATLTGTLVTPDTESEPYTWRPYDTRATA